MHEIVTVTKLGKGRGYYEVASTQRADGTTGSVCALTNELEALQYARRLCEQHRGAPHHAVLDLNDEQLYLLEHGTPRKSEAVPEAVDEPDPPTDG